MVKGDLENVEALSDLFKKTDGLYLALPPVWASSNETDEKEAELGINKKNSIIEFS